jgi:glycosyltransferase involved in cell wall biosynthesis
MTGPLRVTMIGSLPPHRGVSPYVHDLCAALAERDDIALDVISFQSLYPKWLYPGGDPADTNATPADIPRALVRRNLRWWNPVGWLIEGSRMRGDVVHAQWWSFPLAPLYVTLLGIARLRRRRVIITMHNVEPHERGWLRRLANHAVLPLAHNLVVHTEANRQSLLRRGTPAGRISVLPMGIAPAETVTEAQKRDARVALDLPQDAPLVLFAGNIRPYKGVDVLIDAFPAVLAQIPDARLAIVGQPWRDAGQVAGTIDRANIARAVATRLSYVSDDELGRWVSAADVVVYPYTHFDAQSAAAGEALRRGRAIVVTHVGGLADLVDDHQAVAPPRDPAALAKAIVAVLLDSDLRSRLEAGARRRSSELGWDAVAQMTARAYRRLQGLPGQRPLTTETEGL